MSPRPPDFASLFAAGARHDFSHFRAGCVVTVRIEPVAMLRLPSGRLVACEPWAHFGEEAGDYAFTQHVEPGEYPVELIVADFYDPGNPQGNTHFSEVAGARVTIRDEPAVRWRMALQPGQDDADLRPDEFFGYPVDGGTGSFASPESLQGVSTPEHSEALSDTGMDIIDADDVGLYTDEATGYNIVMFSSGGGDGHYGTWVGYSAAGEVVCFVTDFMTLGRDDDEDEEEPDDEPAPHDPLPVSTKEPRAEGRLIPGTPSCSVPPLPLVAGTTGTAITPAAKNS